MLARAMSIACLTIMSVLFSQASPLIALASSQDDQLVTFRDRLAGFETEMQDAQSVLESKPSVQWTNPELEEYLINALWVAFYGNLIQQLENTYQPTAGNDFVNVSAASTWPGNPFRNWEPMQVLTVEDAFSAGDLVFQICPSGYESVAGTKAGPKIIYASFELSVYGADINHGAYGETGNHPRNAAWACQPDGALYTLGYWRESAQQSYEKRRKREEARKKSSS